jgi:hypothetical protein
MDLLIGLTRVQCGVLMTDTATTPEVTIVPA